MFWAFNFFLLKNLTKEDIRTYLTNSLLCILSKLSQKVHNLKKEKLFVCSLG